MNINTSYFFKKMIITLFLASFTVSLKANIHTVDATSNLVFVPATINVIVGDTIRWINVGSTIHTTTSVSIPQAAPSWDYTFAGDNDTFDYEVTVEGVYDYTCTIHPGMDGQFTASSSTGIKEQKSNSFSIYPNPVKNNLNIVFKENIINFIEWNITNLSGKVIFEEKMEIKKKENNIDLNELPAGVYIFNMRDNEKIISRKILKE